MRGPLTEYAYLILDARRDRVREASRRQVLAVELANRESTSA